MNELEIHAQNLKRLGDLMVRLGQGMESKLANQYASEQSPIEDLSSDYESATHGE